MRKIQPKIHLRVIVRTLLLMLMLLPPGLADAKSPERAAYDKEVRTHTERSYRDNKATIDPQGLRGKGHDLDHITPRGQGFREGTPPAQIGAKENLRMLPSSQNRSEGCRGACPR